MKREISMLFADYPSLQSNYTRDNVIKKYKKIDRDERRKREILKELSRMILPSVEVEHLLVDRGSIVVTFRIPNRQTLLKIESIARAKKYKTKRVGRENLINVEGSI
jgi:IS1 family transposase